MQKKKVPKKEFSIRLSVDVLAKVEEKAKRERRSLCSTVAILVEDQMAWEEAAK